MKRAETEAKGLVARWRTRDPFVLCDQLGIHVIECDLPANISGFYQCMYGTKIIYLNSLLGNIRKNVVCAHELGHAVLHEHLNSLFMQESGNFVTGRYECEADLFCAELLIDDLILKECPDIEAIAMRTGISERILKIKYQQL